MSGIIVMVAIYLLGILTYIIYLNLRNAIELKKLKEKEKVTKERNSKLPKNEYCPICGSDEYEECDDPKTNLRNCIKCGFNWTY